MFQPLRSNQMVLESTTMQMAQAETLTSISTVEVLTKRIIQYIYRLLVLLDKRRFQTHLLLQEWLPKQFIIEVMVVDVTATLGVTREDLRTSLVT